MERSSSFKVSSELCSFSLGTSLLSLGTSLLASNANQLALKLYFCHMQQSVCPCALLCVLKITSSYWQINFYVDQSLSRSIISILLRINSDFLSEEINSTEATIRTNGVKLISSTTLLLCPRNLWPPLSHEGNNAFFNLFSPFCLSSVLYHEAGV